MHPETTNIPLTMLAVFGSAKLLAEIFERLKQPAIVGEILAGVLIGPAVLGWIHLTPALSALADLGLLFLLFRVGMVGSFGAWSISGDRGLGPRPYGVSATFPIFFAVLNEMMDRRLRRRNVRAIWQLAESSSEDELAVGAIDCPLKCVNRI